MDSQHMIISNLPVWTMWVIAIAQIIFAVALLGIVLVLLKLVNGLLATKHEIDRHIPGMMKDVSGTVKHVTDSVNHVSNVVTTVATKMESPLIKSVGMAAGVAAGAKTFFGSKKKSKDEKKGGGRFGKK